jgi:glutamate/aspartate transport system substrate-binding protein
VVTGGTTNEPALRSVAAKFHVDMNIVVAPDHAESYAMVTSGKADAFATDEALLYGFIAKNNAQADLDVVGEFLSYEPYGIMYHKGDTQMKALIERVFAEMTEDDDFNRVYDHWFMRRLPSGEHINLPMSPQLKEIFESYGSKPE